MNQDSKDNEYIIIPNPIYDVIFRYLMEDLESATIIISTLINEKIISLNFEPLTHSEKKEIKITDEEENREIRLFHLDFTAVIELPNGTKETIMIELQKASEPDDIFRFKRYICRNFQKKQQKEIIDPKTQAIEIVDVPLRLIPIFILNFRIENEVNDLLIKTSRNKKGIFKEKNLEKHNEFIDNLSYDIYVVQLPNLKNITEDDYKDDEYKSKLFLLLKLFDQKSRVKDNEHRLRLIRKIFPGFLDRIIKRLQAAMIENENFEEQMFAEDEYLKALLRRDNKISFMVQKLEETEQVLNITKIELDTTKDELDLIKEKFETEQLISKKIKLDLAKILKDNNVAIEIIIEKTQLSKQEIDNL